MSDKPRFPLKTAAAVADKIVDTIKPHCERIIVAGSIRRRKETVGDIEILYIPQMVEARDPEDLFGDRKIRVNAVDAALAQLLASGNLGKRKNCLGSEIWGESNKLVVAVKTGIPVNLFTATRENWFNYLVCRTGSAENNVRICQAAQKRHCQWCPTRAGFSERRGSGPILWIMKSEEDVFDFVGLPYLKPEER